MLCCLLMCVRAQPTVSLQVLQQVPIGTATDVQVDMLGNLYLLGSAGQVKKLGPSGDSLAVFGQAARSGALFSMDLSNPLRPLLFYKNYAQVLVLDRNLAPQFTLDLRRVGMQQPLAAAISFDNKVWVFDGLTGSIKKLDEKGSALLETPDLRLALNAALKPIRIFDQDKWLYLYDPELGLYQFDYFGNFKRKIPVQEWTDVLVAGNHVYGIKNGLLQRYSFATLLQEQPILPDVLKGCKVKLVPGKLLAFKDGMLSVYRAEY
ncbi:hypothetical protein SAMN05444008_112198 [Cnuella takakiae]|uniref:Uncharacterized protein n=2 Tax=Cnuella takakiae TaxID=1302690 RepID=A0A1M5EUN9_9BACT|nr:hypothetical protein SAMN05444008_112198 [Cnuella takakiae]